MDAKTQEALENIKKVCAAFVGNLEQHNIIQEAIQHIGYKLEDQGQAEDSSPNE